MVRVPVRSRGGSDLLCEVMLFLRGAPLGVKSRSNESSPLLLGNGSKDWVRTHNLHKHSAMSPLWKYYSIKSGKIVFFLEINSIFFPIAWGEVCFLTSVSVRLNKAKIVARRGSARTWCRNLETVLFL